MATPLRPRVTAPGHTEDQGGGSASHKHSAEVVKEQDLVLDGDEDYHAKRNRFLRPHKSSSFAQMGWIRAKVIRKSVPSHCEFEYSWNLDDMTGTAAATMLKPRAVSNTPELSPRMTTQNCVYVTRAFSPGLGAVSGARVSHFRS
ncbi:hypothetical protein DL769_004188 [Monosporascus sp. CRB-8-3]|nr:hypothetical protein DL769_004188 [Monosporascus sp. CRB-8-3]